MTEDALHNAGQGLWLACVEQLSHDLPEQQYNTWIKPLTASVSEDFAKVTVYAPNRFKLDWIRTQYAGRIVALLEALCGHSVTLELAVAQRESVTRTYVRPAAAADQGAPASHASAGPAHAPTAQEAAPATPVFRTRLNPALTFETLVEGTANRMARAAALHVAGAPGQLYNPLFIYGGVGLGKTHLMHAVGNKLLEDKPDAKVLYIHAEQFVSDVVKAYQRKTFDEFKHHYHSLDLLLIDDVQFFANKDRTQEEFFNAFEALLAKKSHIVMTSDTYPKGLADIHERLVSRFDSGLTVAIEPPELEMRVAILINKARAEGSEMPEDVAFFVAKNVRSNVRELEGALRKILAYSRFNQKEVSIQLAREALRDLLSIQNRQISVENIQKTVADFYKIKVADMYSKKRPASIARPRQIAMYLAKELTQKSLPEIGELFGGRDHTTVLHAVRKFRPSARPTPNSTNNCTCWSRPSRASPIQVCSPRRARQNHPFLSDDPIEADMILFKTTQDKVLAVLQSVCGIVERRHTMPILANVLIRKVGNAVQLTTSDLEIQIRTTAELGGDEGDFGITIGAAQADGHLAHHARRPDRERWRPTPAKCLLKGGKSRFTLQSRCPRQDFPLVQEAPSFRPHLQRAAKNPERPAATRWSFAMAVHDIRYYLNGILFVAEGNTLSLVATDGHRLAFASAELDVEVSPSKKSSCRAKPSWSCNACCPMQATTRRASRCNLPTTRPNSALSGMEFVTKLVEGKFPDYNRVIPKTTTSKSCWAARRCWPNLQRTAIMTSDKFKGVRLTVEPGVLRVASNNAEQEEAVDELDIDYDGPQIDIGFNVTYLIDVLANMGQDMVKISTWPTATARP
jgi:chromosomal replication initiator protein